MAPGHRPFATAENTTSLLLVPRVVVQINYGQVYDQYGRCIIAVSEGVSDKSGAPIITSLKGLPPARR